jgi:hypothetical protein
MRSSAIALEIGTSHWLKYIVVAIHILAVTAVLLAELAWLYRVPIILMIVVSLGMYFTMVSQRAHLKVRCRPDGAMDVWTRDDWEAVQLLPDSLVMSWCVILRYQRAEHRWTDTCVILPDGLNGGDFRRLRVWLRFGAVVGQVKPQGLLS